MLYKAKLLQLKLIHIFSKAILLMKKLEIKNTKPTFIISVLKVEHKARTYLQLPLRQWGASNVYLLVLSS